MAATIEKRLAELALRVANLEQQLATQNRGRRAEMVTDVKKSNVLGSPTITGDSEVAKIQRAEELFASLLDETRLISYSEAYRRIVGPYQAWRNNVHTPEVVRVACQTSPRSFGRLTIRLDALIVGMQTRRPSGGHFANSDYSEAEWIQTFGTWPL